jgi:hypothetical protein
MIIAMQSLAGILCLAAFAGGLWYFRARNDVPHWFIQLPGAVPIIPLGLVALLMAGSGLLAHAFGLI